MSGSAGNSSLNFSADVSKWVEKAKGNADQALQVTAQMALDRVKALTPVKTGYLRANWTVLGPNDAVPVAGQEVDATEAISKLKFGDNVIIVNPTVYAARIEYGFVGIDSLGRSYHQVGRHMMMQTIAELPEMAKEAVNQVNQGSQI